MDYNKMFTRAMEKRGTPFIDPLGGGFMQFCTIRGHNLNVSLSVSFFNPDEPFINILAPNLGSFVNNPEKGYRLCNKLNHIYSWIKYYINTVNNDYELYAVLNAYVDETKDFGNECWRLVNMAANFIDDTYPEIEEEL